ncbi:MAG: hypothetical protein M3070_07230 [Actinomycetota bacterium]|nr:hypothetical protein [Actinomycetota bacterium]
MTPDILKADLTASALRGQHCWFAIDAIAGQPDMTAFKRRARLRQSQWRIEQDLPLGGQLQADGARKPVGSRLDVDFARTTGCNFLSPAIAEVVKCRLAKPERYQMLATERLWSDLLSSMPLCFNLFGSVAASPERATSAVRAWFPDAPGAVSDVRFEWSPGRRDPAYLGNQSAFDVAFQLASPHGARGVIGVETKYHEHAKREPAPRSERLARYVEVTEGSGIFTSDWQKRLVGTDLQQIWVDHLLALSMTQHRHPYQWVKFVLVYPSKNSSFAEAVDRYRETLVETASFATRTIEEILDAPGALPVELVSAFRERYLW